MVTHFITPLNFNGLHILKGKMNFLCLKFMNIIIHLRRFFRAEIPQVKFKRLIPFTAPAENSYIRPGVKRNRKRRESIIKNENGVEFLKPDSSSRTTLSTHRRPSKNPFFLSLIQG